MDDCIFCKIINKEIPAVIFHETDEFIAFLDNHPNNFGHSLLVPKKHFDNIYTLEGKTSEKLGEELQLVSKAIKEAVRADGINIIMNNESAAGQVVFHQHTHIIPRFINDGFKPWPQKMYESPEQKNELGGKIKSKLS